MSFVNVITITSTVDVSGALRADPLSPQETAERIGRFMDRCAAGCASVTMDVQTSGATTAVAASGTLTIASGTTGDTAVVATQTFTSATSPSGNNQYLSTGSDTVQAAALAAAISAHPSLQGVVAATSSGAVVTVTASTPGLVGNTVTLTGSTHIAASAAHLAGGVNATATVMHLGA